MAISTGAAILGGSVLGGLLSSKGASDAASTQADAANRNADLQYKMWQEQQALQEPWRKAGEQALNKLIPLTDYTKFDMDQFQADPGYAFRLAEGQKALERSAAARGGLLSGATGKNLLRYGQEMGSQEYQNAFNRYQAERSAQLQPLQSLAGVGQTATNALGSAAGQYGANAGNALITAGQATAAGQLGVGNTWNNALNTASSAYMNQNNFNNWLAQNRTSAYNYLPSNSNTVIPMQPGGGY